MKKRIMSAFLAFTLVAGVTIVGTTNVKAESTITKMLTVNTVDNVASAGFGVADVYEWPEGEEHVSDVYKCTFTLTKPAYVKISAISTICHEGWSYLGNVNSPTLQTVSGAVIKDLRFGMSKGKNNEAYELLEAGTYNIVYTKENESYSKTSTGTLTTEIDAQYISRSRESSATTMETAIPMKVGEYSTGVISNSYKEQFFELKLTKKSVVSFDVTATAPSVFTEPTMEYKLTSESGVDYTSSLPKQKHLNWTNIYQGYYVGKDYGSINTGNITLSAGTYYLRLSQKSDLGQVKVKPNVAPVNETVKQALSKPKLTKYKKNTKKIVGKAKKGATVKVTVGKKKYTVKANKKGKFTVNLKSKLKKNTRIKIYAKLKGYKNSKTVTYRVK